MSYRVSSLKVLVLIDGIQQDPNKFHPKEVIAIANEIKRLWPNDTYERIWFDVEYIQPKKDWWEVVFRVVCYQMPGKDEKHPIPEKYLREIVNKVIKIYPYNYLDHDYGGFHGHKVEVVHVLE
jgi:hypothetical protein